MPLVIAQRDPFIAKKVAHELRPHFTQIALARSITELSQSLLLHRAQVAVLDLELVAMHEVQELSRGFSNLIIVCTHRSPDERMWVAALNAGAAEFCHPSDSSSILQASRRIRKHHEGEAPGTGALERRRLALELSAKRLIEN